MLEEGYAQCIENRELEQMGKDRMCIDDYQAKTEENGSQRLVYRFQAELQNKIAEIEAKEVNWTTLRHCRFFAKSKFNWNASPGQPEFKCEYRMHRMLYQPAVDRHFKQLLR